MQNSKMSETIKNILEVTDSVLGRPATRGQVIQVLELIESFDTPEPAKAKATTQVKTAKAKTKPKSKDKKPSRRYNSWQHMTPWFNTLLDGYPHLVSYSELALEIRDYGTYNRESVRSRFTTEAKKRGYRYASMSFNDMTGTVLVRSIK